MRFNRLLGELWCGNCGEKVVPDGNRCPTCNHVVREAPLDSVLRAKVKTAFWSVLTVVVIVVRAVGEVTY